MSISLLQSKPYDAIIIGARCAGAATAMLMARAGLKVLVFDRDEYGEDTLSTHILMRGAVMQLERWRLMDEVKASGTPAVKSTTFHYGQTLKPSTRLELRPYGQSEGLYAPRRTALDPILVDAARHAGAEIRFGWSLKGVKRDQFGKICGVVVRHKTGDEAHIATNLLIGADGKNSTVARLVGAEIERQAQNSTAVMFGYFDGPQPEGYEWCYAPGGAAGIAPTTGGQTCAFVGVPEEHAASAFKGDKSQAFRALFERIAPQLSTWFGRSWINGSYRGFSKVRGFFRETTGDGWALVGDAAYFKDPITAHGITDAFRDAELLARAAVIGTQEAMDDYVRIRNELSEDLYQVTDEIASFNWDMTTIEDLLLRQAEAMKAENALLDDLEDIRVWSVCRDQDWIAA